MSEQQTRSIRPRRYIRKNFDWRPYVEEHYDVKYAGEHELRINCPKCFSGKYKHRYKCYVNDEKKVFHCFMCDFTTYQGKYDVFDFVAFTEHIGLYAATRKLLQEYKPVTPEDFEAALAGELDAVPEQVKKFKHPYLESMPEVAVKMTGSTMQPKCLSFMVYMAERGVSNSEMIDMMQTHYVPDSSHKIFGHNGKLKGDIGRRILWPIYGGDNKLVSWQARAFETDDKVKYFNAPDTDISATLWPYVPPKPGFTVVLCEGILDCVALRRAGYAAYACFSKHISKDQIKLLEEWGAQDVVLFWDLDAKKATLSAVKKLSIHFNMFVPNFEQWPEDIDCGDCLKRENGMEHLQAAVNNAIGVDTLDYVKWEIE